MPIAVLVTISQNKAEGLAMLLLEEKACACVNVIKGVSSFFWWEGKIDAEEEAILIIKTKEALFTKLKQLIKDNHPCSVPEIISFKIDNINQEYLDWLNNSCGV